VKIEFKNNDGYVRFIEGSQAYHLRDVSEVVVKDGCFLVKGPNMKGEYIIPEGRVIYAGYEIG